MAKEDQESVVSTKFTKGDALDETGQHEEYRLCRDEGESREIDTRMCF